MERKYAVIFPSKTCADKVNTVFPSDLIQTNNNQISKYARDVSVCSHVGCVSNRLVKSQGHH